MPPPGRDYELKTKEAPCGSSQQMNARDGGMCTHNFVSGLAGGGWKQELVRQANGPNDPSTYRR